MLRLTPLKVIFLGVCLILLGAALGINPQRAAAQGDDTPAEYVGAKACAGCHRDLSKAHATSRHNLTLQDVRKNKDAIQADFGSGDKERTVTLPGESAPRPFKQDDIAYVIGSGRYVERFLYRVDQGKYAVLPAQWNVEKKAWEPYVRGGGTSKWPDDPAYDFTTNCAGCHTTGLDVENSKWQDAGVECEACHGPGSRHVDLASNLSDKPSAEDLTALRGAIVMTPDAQVCGQCHSQGTEPTQKLPFPLNYKPGQNLLDGKVFTLVAPDSKDHWWAGSHAKQMNMQFNEWLQSTHSKSLTTLKGSDKADDSCLKCHSADVALVDAELAAQKAGNWLGDPPAPATLKTAQYSVSCVSCHNPHGDAKIDFSLVKDSYSLCTSCHTGTTYTSSLHHPVQEMFEGKQIINEVQAMPSKHFTSEAGPRCVTCHMPSVPVDGSTRASHDMKPLLPGINIEGLVDSCTKCHTDTSADAMLTFVTDAQKDTKDRLTAAKAALKSDTPDWVKTTLDFIEGDGSLGIHNQRYTAALLTAVERQLGLAKIERAGAPSDLPVLNPADCENCHQKEYQMWVTSPHSQASLNDVFRKEYAAEGRPSFCMGCHSSGYDPKSGAYVYEGVVCTTCHYTENNAKHPTAPFKIAKESAACGRCHSGAHAPTYDEWLISKHSAAKIDCVDCHTPHNNGLRMDDINATCSNCHKTAITDKVHMGANTSCVDCHMKKEVSENGIFAVKTGHSMQIDPATCSNCHGDIHKLQPKTTVVDNPEDKSKIQDLQSEVSDLQVSAQENMATGLAGGAIGVMFVAGLGLAILRRRRVL